MIAKIRTYWKARSPRERLILGFGATFLLGVLIYVLLVAPLLTAARKAEQGLPGLRAQAAEMARLAGLAQRLKPLAGQKREAPSLDVLDQSAKQAGVAAQISDGGDGSYVVQVASVPLADLIKWLDAMQNQQHVFMRETQLTSNGEGLVGGRMVLAP